MSKKEQTLDELYNLVIYQTWLQEQYIKWETNQEIGFILFIIFLLVMPLWLYSWEFLLAVSFIGFLIGPFIMMFLIHKLQTIKYYKWIQELYRLSKWTEKRVEDFNEILMLLKKLKKILDKKWNKLVWLWVTELEIRANQYKYFILLLDNLKSDLVRKIRDMGKTIESASYSLSTHIHWTDELNQVSELQRQRLDKQIEQFEDLQRVLVKV